MAKPTLMQGSKGPDVKILQAALNALPTEYALLIVDGMFGPKTGARVREAQAALGIVIDGVTGLTYLAYTTQQRTNGHIARLGVNYHFNWGGSAPVVARY